MPLFARDGGQPPTTRRAFVQPVCPASGSLPENCRISQVPMKPLRPPRHLCRNRLAPAPRSTTPVESVRLTNAASRCCPQTFNIADFDNASISWLNHAAQCSLSTLRAVVAFDYARLAYGWGLAFAVPAFTGWVPSEWFHLSSTFRYDPPSWASLGAMNG
jgi:hypothetical protein